MRHLYFNLKDLFSNRKGFVILTSLLRFKNKSREFREKTEHIFVLWYVIPVFKIYEKPAQSCEFSYQSFSLMRFENYYLTAINL